MNAKQMVWSAGVQVGGRQGAKKGHERARLVQKPVLHSSPNSVAQTVDVRHP